MIKTKNKFKLNNLIIFIILTLLIIFFFVSSSNPFSSLTQNQKIILAQAYYKVALYYYEHNNKEKGDAFKSVARYLDPNFVQKEISLIPKSLTDEQIELKIQQAKEKAPDFIQNFFKSREKKSLSYPVYNLKTADLFTDETIDVLLNIDEIKYFFENNYKIEKIEYEKAASLSSFLPLVYLDDDLIYILHSENNEKILILLIRNFGIDLKIIGFLPVTKTTVLK
ncbi:MAG TPA: hypothetical protein PLF21_00820 [Exilispira sp.]|nr:hypothetical protein [Exilispira sp.]